MDILRILSISSLAVAIATCAFAFLMYRRISQRLDGLSMAHLTLSRTLQHMVSATMPQPGTQPSNQPLEGDLVESSEVDQKNIVLSEETGVKRVPVSDDDESEDEDSEQSEENTEESDTDNDDDTARSAASTPVLRNLNIMEPIESVDHDNDGALLTLELVHSENECEPNTPDEPQEARIVEIDKESVHTNEESDLELDDEESSNNDEEAYYDDYPDNQTESSNLSVTRESNSERSVQNTDTEQPDDIVAFTNTSPNNPISDLKLQKVETLRKMALEQNLGDEETIRKMKKPQLMSMLSGQ